MNRPLTKASRSCSTLVLVRHAHTDMAGTFCGQSDPPLSPQGIAQLADLNERLKPYSVTHIFSSDLQRARQTSEFIAQCRGLEVELVESLREVGFGEWEGLSWEQVMAREPEYGQQWIDLFPALPAPGGEAFGHFTLRIQDAMTAIADAAPDGCAVAVTHGGVIRTFLEDVARKSGAVLDLTKCDYASCWEVSRQVGQWHLPQTGPSGGASVCAEASSAKIGRTVL